MDVSGIQIQLMLGPTVPVPAPRKLVEALERVEITHNDTGRSGFQLVFRVERTDSPAMNLAQDVLLASPLLQVFTRVIVSAIIKAMPRVLIDGVVTHQQLQPGTGLAPSKLTITGEDISLMLDREEKSVEHPAQPETIIALKIIGSYAQYGLIPLVIPPLFIDPPIVTERTPVQQGTDLAYLKEMAGRHAYTFYVIPGPVPLTNTAYWGPKIRVGAPQPAFSINMGPLSNVESLDFEHNALAPERVDGQIQDRRTNQSMPIMTFGSLCVPLASLSDWLIHGADSRVSQLRATGLSVEQALARAQAQVERTNEEVLIARGELDTLRYGDTLSPRTLIGLRGAGLLYDGLFYVKSVTHIIEGGGYRQRFTLAREGLGTTIPVVVP